MLYVTPYVSCYMFREGVICVSQTTFKIKDNLNSKKKTKETKNQKGKEGKVDSEKVGCLVTKAML